MVFLGFLKKGIQKIKNHIGGAVKEPSSQIDFELIKKNLIEGDIHYSIVKQIVEEIRKNLESPEDIPHIIDQYLVNLLPQASRLDLFHFSKEKPLLVITVLGVNGAGKTTSIAKLAHFFKGMNKKVLIAAGDTFRAAASEQLDIWGQRAGVDVIKNPCLSDPAAVVYEALEKALATHSQVLIIDTAGRLHTKKNLMQQLAKIKKVIEKKTETAFIHNLLILDATSGNNGIVQAKNFFENVGVNSIMLTKLDSIAKGGAVFSISQELKIPISFIGVGENLKDIKPFKREVFTRDFIQNEDSFSS